MYREHTAVIDVLQQKRKYTRACGPKNVWTQWKEKHLGGPRVAVVLAAKHMPSHLKSIASCSSDGQVSTQEEGSGG